MRKKAPRDLPALDESADPLSVWRHWLPHEVPHEIVTRISAVLVARGRAAEPDRTLDETLLRAEARSADAWLVLADLLPLAMPPGDHADLPKADADDVEGSALWLAAHLGSRWARLMLVITMARTACEPALIRRHVDNIPVASVTPGKALDTLRVLDDVEVYLNRTRPRAATSTRAPEQEAGPVVGPSMRVLLASPEPSSNRDDKALVERYTPLASAVLLRPMPSPDGLAAALLCEFPWFGDLIEGIRVELALAHRLGRTHFHLQPILIAGPSGVGKTRFAQRVAHLLDIPAARVIGAGSSDSRSLSGTARGWSTCQPSLPLVVMRRHMVANPMILVDEIDKAGSGDHNGRLADTLTAMMDQTIARRWPDEALLTEADLSQVTWILLCNNAHRVPPTLRARCRVVHVGRPRPCDFEVILRGALHDLATEFDADPTELPDLPPETITAMRVGFEQGRLQPRQLASLVRRVTATGAQGERLMARH